jgi:hypothetical protein
MLQLMNEAGWFGRVVVVGQGWAVFNRLGVWALGKRRSLGVKGRAGWFGLAEVVGQGWAVFNRLGVRALGKRRSLG